MESRPFQAPRGAIPYIDSGCRHHLSSHFTRLAESVNVGMDRSRSSELHIRTSSVEDWWFCRVNGRGATSLKLEPGAAGLIHHAVLVLPLCGDYFSPACNRLFPDPGNIRLVVWQGEEVISSGNFDYLFVYIPYGQLESFADGGIPYGSTLAALSGPGAVLGNALISLVEEVISSPDPAPYSGLLPAFVNLVVSALRGDRSESQPRCHTSLRMRKILAHLDSHLDDPELALDQVAKSIGVSPRQIYREFALAGDTFANRLRAMRLSRAKRILATAPDISISNLAYQLGFSSPSVFGRVFRESYGMTPSRFRAGNRQDRI